MSHPGLRILMTVDAVGGVWQYGLDLARGLGLRGVETVVAVLGPAPSAAQRAEVAGIAGTTLVETGLPLDWLCDRAEPILAAGRQIATLAQDLGADIVQLNMPTLGAAALPGDVPIVAVAHGCVSTWWRSASPDKPLDPELAWHWSIMLAGLQAADRLVAPTDSYAALVASEYGLAHKPQVVHNGRATLAAPPRPISVRPIADRAFTAARLWDRVKRTHLLDRVAARLSVPFDAAGATTAPHGEHVALRHLNRLGQLGAPALADHLAARPVFVSAASFEPFGLAVLEAAQAGCALVLADIPSFRELWDDAALFVAGEDEAAYVAAIEALIADPALRLHQGEAAAARATRYTPQAMADAMLAIYADVLQRRAGQGRAAA